MSPPSVSTCSSRVSVVTFTIFLSTSAVASSCTSAPGSAGTSFAAEPVLGVWLEALRAWLGAGLRVGTEAAGSLSLSVPACSTLSG